MKIDKVDTLTAQSMAEFDIAKRQETAKEVERELLKAYGAGVHYSLVAVNSSMAWNYVKRAEVVPFVTTHQTGNQFPSTRRTRPGREGPPETALLPQATFAKRRRRPPAASCISGPMPLVSPLPCLPLR
ncbi:MAG: hypothetical protein IPO51_11765 [Dehalococcoidia bacterium]|nr:hypothetical protein [Dehalococcoidia bacterium]